MFTPDRARALGGLSAGLGIFLLANGVLSIFAAGSSSGIGALYNAAIALGMFTIGAVPLVLGILAWRAAAALEEADHPKGGRGLLLFAAAAWIVWALPAIAALLVTAWAGSWALPDGTPTVVMLSVVVGTLAGLGVLLAREVGGTAISLAVGLSLVIPLWETSVLAPSFDPPAYLRAEHERTEQQRQAAEEARSRFYDRYGPIFAGPSPAKLAQAADSVGGWRVVSAGTGPDKASCNPGSSCSGTLITGLYRYQRIGELAGQRVRFLLVGQCWVEGDAGILEARIGSSNGVLSFLQFATRPCDGTIHMATSDWVLLPSWSSAQIAAMASPRASTVFASASTYWANAAGRNGPPTERAERWVLLVSPEPALGSTAVRDAIRAAAPDLEIE
jgi:hypothetical protein